MDENENRLGDVPDIPLDETGLIVLDERDDIPAGDVVDVDDGEAVERKIEVNAGDLPARNRGSNGSCVEETGECEIVDITRAASFRRLPCAARSVQRRVASASRIIPQLSSGAGDEADTPLKREIRPRPLGQDGDAISEADQPEDVQEQPEQPGKRA